jgi:CDP-2,3-bis-(O-geranylgeranyl)-sn-glycerol synthase
MVGLELVAVAVWAMLPAYVPNNAAVLVGGGPPIDAGRTLGENRILGDGKTWRGTAGGLLAGGALALGLNLLAAPVESVGVLAPGTLPRFPLAAALGLPAGALLGDMVASFLKRRLDRERGAPVPGLDQLDFVVGALAVTALVAPDWFAGVFTLPVIAAVLVLTPLLHLGTNAVAYRLGLKDEPY